MSENDMIYAEDFSVSEWEDLKLRTMRGTLDLKMPCCNAKAILRSGRSRRQHFAHLCGKSCKSDGWSDYSGNQKRQKWEKSESFDHQRIKEIIREIAEKAGWYAQKEYGGHSSSGDRWIADVYAEKGDFRIIFEIQISPQQFSYYRIRQQRYRESGIKCIWLSCVTPEISDEEIPIFELSKSKGVFVIDFPKFFIPSLLKLPCEFTGVSLGEFIQRMLECCILWEHEWVSKSDQLASMGELQRLPKVLTQSGNFEVDNQDNTSVYTAVRERTSATITTLMSKNTSNKSVTSVFAVRPNRYDYNAHCYKLIFFDANGIPLIDYPWFRGDIGACKRLIALEIKKYPLGTYAEVLNTITNVTVYSEAPLAKQDDIKTPKCAEQCNLFD